MTDATPVQQDGATPLHVALHSGETPVEQGTDTLYTVRAYMWVPYYIDVPVLADSPETACQRALEAANRGHYPARKNWDRRSHLAVAGVTGCNGPVNIPLEFRRVPQPRE